MSKDKMEKYIISINKGGLGNRIKNIVTVQRLAKNLDRTPLIFWQKNTKVLFKDLFQNEGFIEIDEKKFNEIPSEDKEEYREWKDNLKSKKQFLIIDSWRILLLENEINKKFSKVYPTLKGNNVDFEYDRIPAQLKEKIAKDFENLKPQKNILRKVEEFSKMNNISNCVGVHIRRRDFENSPDNRGKISSDENFIERIEEIIKENAGTKFFLSTDSKTTEEKFKERFPKNIISYPKSIEGEEGTFLDSGENGLIDMLILSKTPRILGTYLSTFTEAAWWMGGGNAKVEIMGDYKTKDKKRVIKNLNRAKNPFLKRVLKKIIYNFKIKV